MNTNDLYLEYARVIQMCKGTELEDTPWVCVKLDGEALRDDYGHPGLSASIEKYEFAVAVLEGKPVWIGDKVFIRNNKYPEVNWKLFDYWKNDIAILSKDWKWTPPKRTFTLNGVDLPCPVKGDGHALSIDNIIFCFNNIEDAELVSKSLINLLTEARDKP